MAIVLRRDSLSPSLSPSLSTVLSLRSIVVTILACATGSVIIVASPDLHLPALPPLSPFLSLPLLAVSLTALLVPLPFTTVLIYTARYARSSRCFVVLPGIRGTSSTQWRARY